MNIETLYEMQKELDERIIREKGLEGQDLIPNTVLALQVELGELANEWRGFKHWSSNREPRRERMLEEYVDCLHFFLSIARQLDIPSDKLNVFFNRDELEGDTISVFVEIMNGVGLIMADKIISLIPSDFNNFRKLWLLVVFNGFLRLGTQRLGFTWDEIANAYIDKNKVNHERQNGGY